MTASPKIALSPREWTIVRDVLMRLLPDCEVMAFGSRARLTPKAHSDLDLAVIGPAVLPIERLAEVNDAFESSDLPFKVDVVDWHRVEPGFRDIIRRDAVRLATHGSNLR